jgi:deoxyribodipyrimidine photo-lyase
MQGARAHYRPVDHGQDSPRTLDAALLWFRRDLRVADHAALYHALRTARNVWCVFVFDRTILEALPREDRRVEFIRESLVELDAALGALMPGAGLIVLHGDPAEEIPALARRLAVHAVFANHDDDPYALARDARVLGRLADAGIAWHSSKDHLIFERSEILTVAGTPFSVFTPYSRAWLKALTPFALKAYPTERYADALAPVPEGLHRGVPDLQPLGFRRTNLAQLKMPTGASGAAGLLADFLGRIDRYDTQRDFPALKGPSYLSTHLRFGTISIRRLVREAQSRVEAHSHGAAIWRSELVWRDFYHQVLHHHPYVAEEAFKPACRAIRWERGKVAQAHFAAWCEGRTGYPLVDAAMLQLVQTGYMHNRLRMVSASFLVKDLGLDWRWGERWFAQHLNDFDLAANNGGWQWAASTGTDAQPWFRIFNPVAQSQRFDPQGRFIRRYLPQLAALPDAAIHAPWLARPVDLAAAHVELGQNYPRPLVDHEEARRQTLERFAPAPRR